LGLAGLGWLAHPGGLADAALHPRERVLAVRPFALRAARPSELCTHACDPEDARGTGRAQRRAERPSEVYNRACDPGGRAPRRAGRGAEGPAGRGDLEDAREGVPRLHHLCVELPGPNDRNGVGQPRECTLPLPVSLRAWRLACWAAQHSSSHKIMWTHYNRPRLGALTTYVTMDGKVIDQRRLCMLQLMNLENLHTERTACHGSDLSLSR
jgi:hypothetical protein